MTPTGGAALASRRQVLKALGLTSAVAPLVPSLYGGAAEAAGPKRLLLVFSPCGMIAENFWPSGTETNFGLPSSLEPLAPHKDDLVVIKGLTRTLHSLGGDHEKGTAGLYTGARLNPGSGFGGGGYASGPSVDQILARALPKQTDFASLELGVQSLRPNEGNAMNYISYAGSNQPLVPEGSPYKVFDRLFSGAGGAGPDALAQLRANRRSVIDLVKSEIAEAQTRVGKADRTKMEAHLEATRAIERRLQAGTSGTCPVGKPGGTMDINANANFPAILKLQTDLLVAAFACDRTRIATLMWSRGFSPTYHAWVGASEHHGQSHSEQRGPLAAVDRWYMTQFAYLLEAMKKVPEGNGTMLDNTLVVYCNELNEGRFHRPSPTPAVLAGRLGGTIRTGRFIDYGANAPQNHSQLLVTILHAMGLTNVDKVGDLGPGGRLPNLLT